VRWRRRAGKNGSEVTVICLARLRSGLLPAFHGRVRETWTCASHSQAAKLNACQEVICSADTFFGPEPSLLAITIPQVPTEINAVCNGKALPITTLRVADLIIRDEKRTFRRLPKTNAILFTVRTSIKAVTSGAQWRLTTAMK
jgi:hypothetical protein